MYRWYARISAGVTFLEASRDEFPVQRALEPSLTLGFAPDGGHALELSVRYLQSETTEEWAEKPSTFYGEAPYTISVRAVPVELAYRYRFSNWQASGIAPLAGLGATWTLVEDTWRSDTPAESSSTSVLGATAFLGLEANLSESVAAVVRGQYRETIDAGDRFVQHIGFGGASAHAGLQVYF